MTAALHSISVGMPRKGQVSCTLDRETALRFLGYTGQIVDNELLGRFEQLAQRCESEIVARYVWMVDTVKQVEDGLILETVNLHLPGKDCANHLRGAQYVVLVAVTLGQTCELELRQLKALNTLDFLMYDACASALTEAAGNVVHDQISEEAKLVDLYAHARFSPGYGDLPLSVQSAFLDAVGARKALGLAVNDNNFLVPTKSITAVIGLFEDKECEGESPCLVCAALDYCSFRERGITCHGKRL